MQRTPASILVLAVSLASHARAQPQETAADRGVKLALEGRCADAMPLLTQAMAETKEPEKKRLVGKGGVRCSMILDREADATAFIVWLQREFPGDPDILFLAVHAYSDLSRRNSQELMKVAPDSLQVLQLNAENFEKQGDLPKAVAEYRVLLQRAPDMPGIHYRIGGLILEQPPTATSSEEARKEFEAEIKIYPQNAGAQYYLGELARQADKLPEAIEHFTLSTKLFPDFGEAYYGLGRSLLDSGKAADAVAPLETAAKLTPDNPTVHFALATAYQRVGRKEDAAREFALQKSTAAKIDQNTKALHKNISGASDGH